MVLVRMVRVTQLNDLPPLVPPFNAKSPGVESPVFPVGSGLMVPLVRTGAFVLSIHHFWPLKTFRWKLIGPCVPVQWQGFVFIIPRPPAPMRVRNGAGFVAMLGQPSGKAPSGLPCAHMIGMGSNWM